METLELTIDGVTYRGSYLFKGSARGSGSVVVNYDGGVAETAVIGRQDPLHAAQNLFRAMVANKRLGG
jgi:hypothetical protein